MMVWYNDVFKKLKQFYKVYQKDNKYVGLKPGTYNKFLVIFEK